MRTSLADLRSSLVGRTIQADDADYDAARTVVYGGIDKRPQLIVRVADTGDVSRVVRYAQENGVGLAVRGGGHSIAGHSLSEGGMVIDVRDLKSLTIDAATRTAWVDAGVTAGEFTAAAAEHGLAVGFGDTGSVGIPGITLNGGVGFLVRKHGLTIDSLLAAELVTADGETRNVDAQSDPDLFWAIRGGGGNFGVVTRLKFQLHELDGIVGGMLILPAAAEVISGFAALADSAPDELSTLFNVMPAPPMPFIPAQWHGKLIVFAQLAYAGPAADGERVLAPFRALAGLIADLVRPMPYPELFPPEDDSYHPTAVAQTMFIDGIDESVAGTVLDYLEKSDAAMHVAQIRVLGGAMARVPADATAFAHRQSRIMVNVAAFYDGPEDKIKRLQWVAEFADALRQNDTGAYVGFLGDEGETRVRQAYPGPTWDRLVEIKRRYDPANLFRLNQNIPPAA